MPGTLQIRPARETYVEVISDLKNVTSVQRTRGNDAFDVLVAPGQRLLDTVNFPSPAIHPGPGKDRAPCRHDRRVFDEDRIRILLVSVERGYLQPALLERPDIPEVLGHGLV